MRSKSSLLSGFVCSLGVVFAGLTALDAKADVRVSRDTYYSMDVEITGTISEQDASKFAGLSDQMARKLHTVHLDSKGGDVFAAMKIGRIIRAYDGETWPNLVCYSSCALIFIAGVIRTSYYSEIGLHRPYLASSPQSRDTIEKQMPIMLAKVKSYVDEMGVPNTFYEQMMGTEPSKMIVYRGDAIHKIVPERDPIYDELLTAANARHYGISTLEMRERWQDAKKCYDNKNDEFNCREAMLWGLSERRFAERYDKAKRECQFSEKERFDEEETKIFWNTPSKRRLDLPFFVQFEDCTRKIMQGQ